MVRPFQTVKQTNKQTTSPSTKNSNQTKPHWVLRDQVRCIHFKDILMASLQAERPLLPPNAFLECFILKENSNLQSLANYFLQTWCNLLVTCTRSLLQVCVCVTKNAQFSTSFTKCMLFSFFFFGGVVTLFKKRLALKVQLTFWL